MDEDKLHSYLKKVGMECFINHLTAFADSGQSNSDVAQWLVKNDCIQLSSARTKTSKARVIIKAGETRQAIALIAASQRVNVEAVRAARRWLIENPV